MKVIIHGPSLPLLLVAIVLDLPVVKVPPRPRKQEAETSDTSERTAETGIMNGGLTQ